MKEESEPALNLSPITPADARQVAVAIKSGTPQSNGGPTVVASGYGSRAQEILAIAFQKGIKVRSDGDLAQLLAALDQDSPIPSEAIVAVAEILARVYQANARYEADTAGSPPPSVTQEIA